jgi:hypothetical protein
MVQVDVTRNVAWMQRSENRERPLGRMGRDLLGNYPTSWRDAPDSIAFHPGLLPYCSRHRESGGRNGRKFWEGMSSVRPDPDPCLTLTLDA